MRFFNTIKHLRSIQIYYRVEKKFKKILCVNCAEKINLSPKYVIWKNIVFNSKSLLGPSHFSFLNQEKKFSKKINWDFQSYGKLWTYNLNYFDFLNQEGVSKDNGLALIYNYIENSSRTSVGIESFLYQLELSIGLNLYPIIKYKINILTKFFKHLSLLYKNLEYHLWEIIFWKMVLLYYLVLIIFVMTIYKKSKRLLESELNKLVLNDGAHFELSPMYHQLLLTRVLDYINLIVNNPWKKDSLHEI